MIGVMPDTRGRDAGEDLTVTARLHWMVQKTKR